MSLSLIQLTDWDADRFEGFARQVLAHKNQGGFTSLIRKSISLLFLEPSTRTRLSFERAAHHLGYSVSLLSGVQGSSLEKGESPSDTFLNLIAMQPDAVVVRSSDAFPLIDLAAQTDIPLICAGWGKKAHPTQALLDAVTLFEHWQSLQQQRILFCGDLAHSRVLASHRELLSGLGIAVGFWSPPEWQLSNLLPNEILFTHKKEALEWAQAIIGLRWQKERHESDFDLNADLKSYQLKQADLLGLKNSPLILHPGPVGWGEEFHSDIQCYPFNKILTQVHNGVWTRAQLLLTATRGQL